MSTVFIVRSRTADELADKMITSVEVMQGICLRIFFVLFLVSYVSPYTTTVGDQQQFAIEPLDQIAVVGTRVILPCRVLYKKGTLQWTKDDFGLGTHRRLNAFERYTMIGSDEEGDYSLSIHPITLEDDAIYQW